MNENLKMVLLCIELLVGCIFIGFAFYQFMLTFVEKNAHKWIMDATKRILCKYCSDIDAQKDQIEFELENLLKQKVVGLKSLERKYKDVDALLRCFLTKINDGIYEGKIDEYNENIIKRYIFERCKIEEGTCIEELDEINRMLFEVIIDELKEKKESLAYKNLLLLGKEFLMLKKSQEKSDLESKKQFWLAIAGIVVSVLFGMLSIIL